MLNRFKQHGLIVFPFIIFITTAPTVHADKAGLMLFPTRFILSETERTVSIDIINKGNARGSYRIELIDMKMPETGAIRELKEGETDPYSIKGFARISPRRAVLRPDTSQKIRILLRRPKDLADGEYRSHLKVLLTEDNLDEVENTNPTNNNISIKIKPRLAFTVPIIVRQGDTHYAITIDDANVHYADRDTDRKNPILKIHFSLEGNQSSMGDIKVSHIGKNGKSTIVNFQPGIAIYRNTNKRSIDFPLSVPEGVILDGGELHIVYLEKMHETDGGGKIIAEKKLKL